MVQEYHRVSWVLLKIWPISFIYSKTHEQLFPVNHYYWKKYFLKFWIREDVCFFYYIYRSCLSLHSSPFQTMLHVPCFHYELAVTCHPLFPIEICGCERRYRSSCDHLGKRNLAFTHHRRQIQVSRESRLYPKNLIDTTYQQATPPYQVGAPEVWHHNLHWGHPLSSAQVHVFNCRDVAHREVSKWNTRGLSALCLQPGQWNIHSCLCSGAGLPDWTTSFNETSVT